MPWISSVNALIHAWYGGNELGNAIADVIFGDVNPSAKLPLSFPKRVQDNPAFLNYRTEGGRTLYGEDVYIGYRWYEKLELPVLFPFGHGLSYTTFSLANATIKKNDKKLIVGVTLANTGDRAGSEVVQVYVSQQAPSIKRPKKELKGFEKVSLDKGETKTVEIEIELKYATSFWDEVRNAWKSEKDKYNVIIGTTSHDSNALIADFEMTESTWWNGL
jgi:beta-glucosidase